MEVSLGTLFGQGLTFLVFILVTYKFVWPPLMNAMEERRAKIADGLAAGEKAEVALDEARAEADKIIREARSQAGDIREQASTQASQIRETAKSEAQAERDRQVDAAKAEIEQEAIRTRKELASKVASLAVIGAEKILNREIDASAHADLLDSLSTEI